MKVLYANTTLPPLHFGGSEVYCMGLAKNMPRLGVETAAVCIESWGDGDHRKQFRRAETYDGVRIHRLYSNEMWEPVSTLWTGSNFYVEEFEKILDEEKPDLIHVMAHLRMAKLLELAHKRGIPVVLTGVDFSPFCGRSSLVKWDNDVCDGKAELTKCRDCLAFSRGLNPEHWNGRASRAWNWVSWMSEQSRDRVYRIASSFKPKGMGRVRFYDEWGHRTAQRIIGHTSELFPSLSRVFAPSPIMHEMWAKNGYPEDQIVDFPYGVDVQGGPTGRYKTHSKEFRFGFIGRFNGLKNLRTLLEAFFLIEGSAPVSLSLWGAEDFWDHGNPEIDALKRMAEKCTKLHFKGRVSRQEIAKAYEEVDCLVTPSSWYENAPISMMEAQYFGTPIICTDLPGMTCLVEHEVNGLVFRNKSARGLALQMYRMATEPDLYERLRANSIPIQTMEENAADLLPYYLEVAGKSLADLNSGAAADSGTRPAANSATGSAGGNGTGRGSANLTKLRTLSSTGAKGGREAEKPSSDVPQAVATEVMDCEEERECAPVLLKPVLRQALEEFGVPSLEVLVLGSGLAPMLGWAVDEGLCRVTAVDPRAEFPVRPESGAPAEGYHIALAADALGQAEFPVPAFHSLAAEVRPGGYVCVQHGTREEDAESSSQAPLWDVWDEDGVVLVGDPERKAWRLDQGLGLEQIAIQSSPADSDAPRLEAVFRKPGPVAAGGCCSTRS